MKDSSVEGKESRETAVSPNSPVGLDSEVYPGVLRQVAGVGEALVALRALVGLGLPHVDLGVQLEVGLGAEDLQEKKEKFECNKNIPGNRAKMQSNVTIVLLERQGNRSEVKS